MTVAATGVGEAGAENELRLRRRLWGDRQAIRAVRSLGLTDATVRRFALGLKEPYVTRATGAMVDRALAFPVRAPDGSRTGRWSYLNLDGVTSNAPDPVAWGPGPVRTCYSRAAGLTSTTLLIVPTVVDMWLISQALGETFAALVVASPSRPGDAPCEWGDAAFWRRWDRVVLGLPSGAAEDDLAFAAGRVAGRQLCRCAPPGGETWADLVRTGASAAEIRALVDAARAWAPLAALPAAVADDAAGDFEADPVAIEGAFVGGLMHYPLTVERREVEDAGRGGTEVVQRYVTRVLRSDGVLLDVERLPAPRGTPASGRVLAMSDGTRIIAEPVPSRFATWRFPSIREFIAARGRGCEPAHRPLARLLADVEAHLRTCLWLPHDEDFALAATFVAATFAHRAFEAFPILLVNGPKGTGKTELGQALASVACNALVAGRITPAGLVRLLAETRGTVVLDDLETIGNARTGDDVAQILKTSYKAATARRVSPGRDGRVEVLDYFAPKVVTNIAGADTVLLSRMLAVRTGPMPEGTELPTAMVDAAALRDELHTWAMCRAGEVIEAYEPFRSAVRERRAEIAAPLRAMAALAGDETLAGRLEVALAAEPELVAEPPEAVMSRALRGLVEREGVSDVAMPRLMLEMAASAKGPIRLPSSETLGRMLLGMGAREADGRVERRRLHGEIVRVYGLSARFLEKLDRPSVSPPDPFGFCAGACEACPYDPFCDATVPGLRVAKRRRGG